MNYTIRSISRRVREIFGFCPNNNTLVRGSFLKPEVDVSNKSNPTDRDNVGGAGNGLQRQSVHRIR
jgi:hypothetical protein